MPSTEATSLTATKTNTSSIWMHPNFLILFISGAMMTFGNKIYELALPLILYQWTSSSVAMSTMRGIEFLPNLLLAMFIGVFVDRVRKKQWSLWAVLIQMILLFLLYFLSIRSSQPSMAIFYIGGFLLMTCNYAVGNARVGMVKHTLPNEMLTAANASFNFITTLIGIMGPAITGLVLMLPRLQDSLFLTGLLFIIGFVTLLFLRSDEMIAPQKQQGFWRELYAGWTELRSNRLLWLITLTVIFLNATSGMVDTTIIFFAKDTLRLENFELGLVLSAAGAGGLIGSFLLQPLRRRFEAGVIVTMTTLLVGFTYAMLYFAHSGWWLAAALFLNGLFETISTVSIWTFRQETTPHHLIGRISGITGSLFKLGMPFAIFAAGWISELANPTIVFGIAMLGNVIIFLCCRCGPLWTKKA
ncbi:MFS transporter [Paenibacillus guangzhouensis]|uniref:MFS transporter n=1 Tax=Paenibacillus guangzhouensis TaxID=1473112 RepID=UPI00126749DE|nr:MFS transporter [Paenibacillus guangzhouensis]